MQTPFYNLVSAQGKSAFPPALKSTCVAFISVACASAAAAAAHAQNAALPVLTPPPATSGAAPETTNGGPFRSGDLINLLVAGEAALSGAQRIASDGTVTVPLAGQVKVAGLLPSEAADKIAGIFKTKKILRAPQVSVYFAGRADRTIFISGALTTQGRVPITDTTTLNEVVEPAGILPTSNLKRVTITRGDKKIVVDYASYRAGNDSPDSANNPALQDGDKIYVQALIQNSGTIKVDGEVKSPQTTGLTDGMTVMQAIQQVGGVSDFANRDQITVMRSGKEIVVPFKEIQEGQKNKDIVLQDKDEIFVKRREKPPVYYVNGGVVNRNTFPLVGSVTLSDAIAAAGGTLDQVDKKKVVVQHKTADGQVEAHLYDLTKVSDASAAIAPEDIVAVPYPPEKQPKRDPLSLLGPIGTIFLLFRR